MARALALLQSQGNPTGDAAKIGRFGDRVSSSTPESLSELQEFCSSQAMPPYRFRDREARLLLTAGEWLAAFHR